MYEWVHRRKFTKDHFNATYPSEHGIVELFDLAGKITNGTKHFRRKATTHVQVGFSSDFSDEFERPLNVELPGGNRESVDRFVREMVEFWKRHVGSTHPFREPGLPDH